MKTLQAVCAPVFAACLVCPLYAQTQRNLWVVRSPNVIVEYDANTLATKQKIIVPDSLPNEILRAGSTSQMTVSISSLGQILYVPSVNAPESGQAWFWDGKAGAWIDRHRVHSETADRADSKFSTVDSDPVPFLSADGRHLLWFANTESDYGLLKGPVIGDYEPTTQTAFRAWQTDLAGGNEKTIAAISIPMCKCQTGYCEDTCPTIEWYVGKARQADFFVLTQVIRGQEEAHPQASTIYHEVDGQRQGKNLAHPVEAGAILDATDDGLMRIQENGVSSNSNSGHYGQVWLRSDDKSALIFDPFQRVTFSYDQDYLDLWFRTAEISPSRDLVAWDVCLGGNAGQQFDKYFWACPDVNHEVNIPLDAGPKPSAAHSAAAQKFLTDLPAVEVVSLTMPGKLMTRLPHANLIGWLNDSEVVVLERNEIEILDIGTGAVKDSGISVEDWRFVFVR